MAVYYALSRDDPDAGYQVYGKGADTAAAEEEAAENIRDQPDAETLHGNLTVLERAEAEERGLVTPGAPVIWYAHLGRYQVEDHQAPANGPRPTGVTSR